MWISERGVMSSVALPDPTAVMSKSFVESLLALTPLDTESTAKMIASEEIVLFEYVQGCNLDSADERRYEGLPPEGPLLTRAFDTIEDLRALIREVEPRWRLDALCALDDYLSEE